MNPDAIQTVLRYLADLAPAGRRNTDVVTRKSEFAWLGGNPLLLSSSESFTIPKNAPLSRLAGIDALQPAERLLRLGWLFIAGTIEEESKPVRYCLPLLSVPVRLANRAVAFQIVRDGNPELPDDLFDWDARLELEESTDPYAGGAETQHDRLVANMPQMAHWVTTALERAGLPAAALRGGSANPLELRDQQSLSVVAGAGIYPNRDVAAPDMEGVLRTWAYEPLAESALGAVYGAVPNETLDRGGDRGIRSPLPLNRSQREALARTRTESVTVVSGPPGTGKSHLVAATAIDQVADGKSVLVATQSRYAAAVIAELIERHPGPRFVRFGSRDDRESVAADLADGLARPLSSAEYRDLEAREASAATDVDRLHATIGVALERETDFRRGLRNRELNMLTAAQMPGVLDDGFDLDEAEKLLHRARTGTVLFRAWTMARATRKLRRLTRGETTATLDDLDAGLDAARSERAIRRGLAGGGLTLVRAWDELEVAESRHRDAVGRVVEAQRRSRDNSKRRSTRAVATLASALRAGRARRRQLLRELTADDFLDVLPLWIGTLQEIDDTLPVVPNAFDLVIFDEASQIDQMRAAPALARARRAMIVGDPRQLRHVSFVSDEAMEEGAVRYGLDPGLARLLDVRRNSLFDTGAAASRITWLDEHFRSVPHIIEFSDRTFYSGKLRLMTQHPRNETRDAIATIALRGTRDGNGVNRVEIEEVMRQIEIYAATGTSSIGVITPFRAQADAIEEAILAAYGPEDVDRLGLRAGTVHAFQGSERDVVIASLAIDGDASGGSLNFLQNPNLFNVMITRAKREMVVVTSIDPPALPSGLLADYLRYAEQAPHRVTGNGAGDEWTGELAGELKSYGVAVVPSYPVAGWSVDLSIGERDGALGVETSVHPDGAETHIEQHLALRRAGWAMVDAFQSKWLTDAGGAAAMLSQELLRRNPAG